MNLHGDQLFRMATLNTVQKTLEKDCETQPATQQKTDKELEVCSRYSALLSQIQGGVQDRLGVAGRGVLQPHREPPSAGLQSAGGQ